MNPGRSDTRTGKSIVQSTVGGRPASRSDNVEALKLAIMEEAEAEALGILADAEAEARAIKQQAGAEAQATGERIFERAQHEVEVLRSQALAAARLEAQALMMGRREQLLDRAFASVRVRLASIPQRPDSRKIAEALILEAVEHLGAQDIKIRLDTRTRSMLSDETVARLAQELDVRVHATELLRDGTGVIVETIDGHRVFDNTLETRLTRLQDALRAPVYRILIGEMP